MPFGQGHFPNQLIREFPGANCRVMGAPEKVSPRNSTLPGRTMTTPAPSHGKNFRRGIKLLLRCVACGKPALVADDVCSAGKNSLNDLFALAVLIEDVDPNRDYGSHRQKDERNDDDDRDNGSCGIAVHDFLVP